MYISKTTPFDHQRRAAREADGREGFAYLMEMGTGKTKVMIDEAGRQFEAGRITALLVIAPKGVCGTWIEELRTHLGLDSYIAERWSTAPKKNVESKLRKMAQGPVPGHLIVAVMNVEAFGAGTKAQNYAEQFLRAHRAGVLVDESQTIKNPSAKRTKKIMSLGPLAAYRRIATGTPAPNSPMDLWSQMEFVSPGSTRQRSFFGFRSRYSVLQEKIFGGRRVKVEVGYRNTEELSDIVARHSFRVRKADCLDLLDKIYTRRDVELTSEQSRTYQQMAGEALATFGSSFSSSQSAITTLIRLQQIVCGYIRDDDGDLHYLESNRVQAVLDVCEQTEGDVIIWVGQHTPMIPVIQRELESRFGAGCVARFWGGNAGTRDEEALEFVQNPLVRFMLSTQAAGGRGNTWVNASCVVFFANTYNLEERMQSEDRCHRAGQTNRVLYTDLNAEGVRIDTRLIEALRRKENMSASLVGDSPRVWL